MARPPLLNPAINNMNNVNGLAMQMLLKCLFPDPPQKLFRNASDRTTRKSQMVEKDFCFT